MNDLKKFKTVADWLRGLKGTSEPHSTKYSWLHHLKRFCDWSGESPDELIEDRKAELKSDDEGVPHTAEKRLQDDRSKQARWARV